MYTGTLPDFKTSLSLVGFYMDELLLFKGLIKIADQVLKVSTYLKDWFTRFRLFAK